MTNAESRTDTAPTSPLGGAPRPASWRLCVWLLLIVAAAVFALSQPEWLELEHWRRVLRDSGPAFVLLALLLQWLMAVLMLPTLPLVAALAWLMPERPELALTLAMLGVLGSALAIHRAARVVGLTGLAHSHPRVAQARAWIARHGAPALALWCLAPFLPSDLGCYVAASARMPLPRFLAAVLAGELVLCASVIYGVVALHHA